MAKVKSTIVITPRGLDNGELPMVHTPPNSVRVPLSNAIRNPAIIQNPGQRQPFYGK